MKILITHASAGAGHRKAAEALYMHLRENTSHEVVLNDALDHASPLYKKLYTGTYSLLITYIPFLWGLIFSFLDLAWMQPLVRGFRRVYNQINMSKFNAYLCKEQFDYIFSTHFMPNEVTAALKRDARIKARLVSVITDYDVHRVWLAKGIDIYAVACEYTKEKCKHLGVLERQVFVSGIPSDKKFAKSHDIVALKEKFGLQKDAFTVLIATGSFGIGPIEELVDQLGDFQVIVICGHNKTLFERLRQKDASHVFVNALVDNMDELMAVSDCMVTKPGGLSITEAMVSQLPLIFFNAIPGQEARNVKVLKRYGIGIGPCGLKEIYEHLYRMRTSKDVHRNAVNKLKELARPQSVKDLQSLIT